MTYDIFISYRRDAFESANLFATRLKALGYRVFFDIETMNAGKFNEQLLDVISKCKDFILVLSPNALDRCADEQDWVRREVMCAMEHKKNIIPIMLSGFVWPAEMPKGMEELCNYQALAPAPNTYYDLQVQRLRGYLKSKAHFQTRRKWLIGMGIAAAVVVLILVIGHLTYMPAALRVADTLTSRTQAMDNLSDISKSLQADWEEYVKNWKSSKTKVDKADYKEEMNTMIVLQEREAQKLLKTMQSTPIQVSEFHLPLFWIHGINPADLLIVNSFTEGLFDDLNEQIAKYRDIMAVDDYSRLNMQMAKINAEVVSIFVDTYYYGYLQMMTHLPKSTHKSFYQISSQWTHLPNAGLNLSDEEYERQQMLLAEQLEKDLAYQEQLLLKAESDLEEQQAKLDSLEEKANEVQRIMEQNNQLINQYIQAK